MVSENEGHGKSGNSGLGHGNLGFSEKSLRISG